MKGVINVGCDIHMYVEKKKNGKWVPAQGMIKDEDSGIMDVPYPDTFYNERNYLLFGFLTGGEVRREMNSPFKLKGFPKNASPEIRKIYEQYGCDAHSPSYLTLEELETIDWNTTVPESGLMQRKQATIFKRELKKPIEKRNYDLMYPYCQGTNMNDYVEVAWEIPISYEFKIFRSRISLLHTYDYKCKPSEIRIVFWFDN